MHFLPCIMGGLVAQAVTIPMSRLEGDADKDTYDLPFHVFVD